MILRIIPALISLTVFVFMSTPCISQFKYGVAVESNITKLKITNSVFPIPSFNNVLKPGYGISGQFEYQLKKPKAIYVSGAIGYKRIFIEQSCHTKYNENRYTIELQDDYLHIPISLGCQFYKGLRINAGIGYLRLLKYKGAATIPLYDSSGVYYSSFTISKNEVRGRYSPLYQVAHNYCFSSLGIEYQFELSEMSSLSIFLNKDFRISGRSRSIDYGEGYYFSTISSFTGGLKILLK